MNFKQFNKSLEKHFDSMCKESRLFEIDVDKDEFWNLYLDSFPPGTNEIYRERREYDCNCCRHFFNQMANVVAIKNNKIVTLWDFELEDKTFQTVINALSSYLQNKFISNIFVSREDSCGKDHTLENKDGIVKTWEHFYLEISPRSLCSKDRTAESIQGEQKDIKNVLKRSLNEISEQAVDTVLELISQNSLYRGAEWEKNLKTFRELQKEYKKITNRIEKDNFCWNKSTSVGPVIGKIKNHSIGTLLANLTHGMEIDTAVKKYENIVAGPNYKRPKPIFTKKMLEDAQKEITKLGYMESLGRRYAILDDIKINNVLFSNRDSAKRIAGTVFDDMMSDVVTKPKKFDRVEEIPVENFIKNVLPTASEIELYFEGKHINNLVSLIAPQNKEALTMFKWNNGFSWAYKGNMTDSDIRENVKLAGGKVDGVLRFSIQWNDFGTYNWDDLDAHCRLPNGIHEIFFAANYDHLTNGKLDIDITSPVRGQPAVENITWPSKDKMVPGEYKFFVVNFCNRGGTDGFQAEIEFDDQIYSFSYRKPIRQGETIPVATVILDKDRKFSIKECLDSQTSSKEIWNIKTNQFIPVSVIMFSPNYWDEQHGIGNKHYFFMLKDCINDETPNGFYNEFLKAELNPHRKVLEALGAKMKVQDMDDQLSGVGFSSTLRNNVILRVKGTTERLLKVLF